MPRYIDIDDDRNCYIGNDGEYERYNIDPDVLAEAVEIIHCKDCRKHNIEIGDYEELPDGKRKWFWKADCCPLVAYRGKAKVHEFDYQYCSCAERREDETD